ncbi:MAG: hypothetical protein E7408_05560 [Ruminococcaceae bacterium]|nr:hypothetical protein [Oscillospiraceae bacterium]
MINGKRICALLLCIMLCSAPALAADARWVPVISDGFEGENHWQVQTVSTTATYRIGETAQAGEKGFTVTTEDYRGVELCQSFKVPTDGRNYVFSAYVNGSSASDKAGATLLVRSKNGTEFAKSSSVITKTNGTWIKETLEFTLSAASGTEIEFVLKWNSVGTVHWDTVSVTYAMGAPVTAEASAPIGPELLPNPGFEDMTDWYFDGTGTQTDLIAAEGEKSVQLNAEKGKNSFVFCRIYSLEAGATYALRFKILATETGTRQAIKMQYYTDYGSDLDSFRMQEQTVGAWHEYLITFSPPVGIYRTEILFRTYEKGVTYYDDLSLKKIAEPVHTFFDLNEIYYYTDLTHGYARLDVNEEIYPAFSSWTASVTVENARGVKLYEGEKVSLSTGKADIPFPLNDVPISDEACTVKCTVWSGTQILETYASTFFRQFPRPSMLTKDGKLQKDGKPLSLVYGYHVTDDELDTAKELGINTILIPYDYAKDPEAMWDYLDMLQNKGLYGIACLYVDMESGGSPENIEYTKTTVENARNHPALIGYAVMDEPIGNDSPEKDILAAYCAIRERDSIHPVYMTDMYPSYYRTLTKWTDLVAPDHYPANKAKSVYYTGEVVEQIEELVSYSGKSIGAILQFFPYNGYYPSADEMRNMLYQCFFSGADSIGYYALDYSVDGVPVEDTETGDALREFAVEEQQILFDHFVHGKYEKLSQGETDAVEWERFSDGETVYVAVRNKSVDAPLSMDIDSGIRENAYIRIVGGAAEESVEKKANGVYGITLPAAGAALYEFTDSTDKLIFYDGIFAVGELVPGETVSVLYNGTEQDAKLYIALYKETENCIRLIDFVISEESEESFSIPRAREGEKFVLKAHAWSGELKPLTESIVLKDK